jgi:hypothetical protein
MPKEPSSTEIPTSPRRRSVLVAVQKPATRRRPLSRAKRPARRASRRAVAQRFSSTSKGGGRWVCYSSHGLPTRQRSTLCGYCELATLHSSCVERITPHIHASPPCPVARVPFLSSCARVRKRDEVMSVQIRTQTLHESRSGLVAGHCLMLCSTVAGTPQQPPHGEECQCMVETGLSGKGMTSCRNFAGCALCDRQLHAG